MFRLKRAYEAPSPDDGLRVLVERLWPRGISKDKAEIDLWLKDAAPSTELRKWFGHDPAKWGDFRRRYLEELEGQPEAIRELKAAGRKGNVTLIYAARDEEHNSAVVLKQLLAGRKRRG